ncbi:hypothetical protein CLV67_113289 [Actinoplanes italicus]|uniref:Uncharacterized protein n=1 Tax=Actinoplanes italicus TaxID=113567 RepID=A0A2T0K643_9ACTN|nr:hypothetical protein CLV67_113289 [Actinoplanes italicus]
MFVNTRARLPGHFDRFTFQTTAADRRPGSGRVQPTTFGNLARPTPARPYLSAWTYPPDTSSPRPAARSRVS